MHLDHISIWTSQTGAVFIMNEPYYISRTEITALEQKGYGVQIVPEELAPYGGRFDDTPGAKSWTRSLLITQKKNLQELNSICLGLSVEALTAPDWNT